MPIGATIGAAVIGAGATAVASSSASHSQQQAAQTASDTALQVANTNNAFAQSMYDQDAARLDPYSARGNTAGDAIMGLLLGEAPTPSGSTGTGAAGSGSTATGTQSNPGYRTGPATYGPAPNGITAQARAAMAPNNALAAYDPGHPLAGTVGGGGGQDSPALRAARMGGEPMGLPSIGPQAIGNQGAGYGGALSHFTTAGAGTGAGTGTGSHTTTPPVASGGTASALNPWDQFRNSTNYQFRLDQGLNATASKYAANGAFESGAEKKAINDYAQNFASNELANYMDQLYRQEALGATAASSLAGVGTNLVSQVTANNTHAGDASSNAALVSGQAAANNANNIGGAISSAAGAIGGAFSSSYHPSNTGSGIIFTGGAGYTGGGF